MKKIIIPIFKTALTIFILAWFLPSVTYTNWTTLLIAAVVLTFLQTFAKPILKLLFLPINFVTMGLFSFVINIFLLWLATFLVPGFTIGNLAIMGMQLGTVMSLIIVSFIIGFLQSLIGFFIKK